MLVTICTWTGILVDSNLLYLQFYDIDVGYILLGAFCGSGEFSVQSSSSKIVIHFHWCIYSLMIMEQKFLLDPIVDLRNFLCKAQQIFYILFSKAISKVIDPNSTLDLFSDGKVSFIYYCECKCNKTHLVSPSFLVPINSWSKNTNWLLLLSCRFKNIQWCFLHWICC